MKAISISEAGGPDVLKMRDLPLPEPGAGEARVRIHAAGVNYVDVYQRKGANSRPLPFTPGLEAAGVVDAVGPSVDTVKVGDRVAYTSMPGAYAEASVVNADWLIRLPDSLSFEEGAAFPLQGMTAHYLTNEFRKPGPGEAVLIHAAAGGMGLLLTQWAKHLGARVLGTVSTEEKARAAREAGADEVILYTQEDFAAATMRLTDGQGAVLIIDGVGKTTFPGDLRAAARRGTIVVFGAASGPVEPVSPNVLIERSLTVSGGSLSNYLLTPEEQSVRSHDVLRGISEGWLKLNIGARFPLAEAAKAHQLLESRASTGKIVLTVQQ